MSIYNFNATHIITKRTPKPSSSIEVVRNTANLLRLTPYPIQLANGELANFYVNSARTHALARLGPRPLPLQQRVLTFLRDNVNSGIPAAYYRTVLGHDLHIGTYAELFARQYHATERDPYDTTSFSYASNPVVSGRRGWVEELGLVCTRKVTQAFRNFEVAQLQAESSEYGDFKFHRPGTNPAAENNNQTALSTDAGLEGTGTQVQGATADIYKSVATVTADATETWQEHGLFSQTAAAGTMMDRNLISPTVAVVNLDTVEFTFELTKTAEA
jgi:hypothetical protein